MMLRQASLVLLAAGACIGGIASCADDSTETEGARADESSSDLHDATSFTDARASDATRIESGKDASTPPPGEAIGQGSRPTFLRTADGAVYWIESGSDGADGTPEAPSRLVRFDKTTKQLSVLLERPADKPIVTLSLEGSRVYFVTPINVNGGVFNAEVFDLSTSSTRVLGASKLGLAPVRNETFVAFGEFGWMTSQMMHKVSVDGDGGAMTRFNARVGATSTFFKDGRLFASSGDVVMSFLPDGGGVQTLALEQAGATSVRPDESGTYWGSKGLRAVVALRPFRDGGADGGPFTDAGTLEALYVGQRAPIAVHVDGTHVYWCDDAGIMRAPKAGGAAVRVVEDEVTDFDSDETALYWTSETSGRIAKLAK